MVARRRTKAYSYLSTRRKSAVTPWAMAYFRGFTGLNNKYSNIEIADTESPDCMNVEFDAVGAIVKRNGYQLLKNFGSQKITSILQFFTPTQKLLLLTFGTSIVSYDPVAGTSTTIVSNLHGNGLRFSAAMDTVHNKIYMVNGDTTDGLMSWDGTNFTHVVGAPNGQYLLYYKNHLYMSGDPANPNRLYMSQLGDPSTWDLVNLFIDFDDGLGGITGIRQLGDSIVVMKESGPQIMKGTDPSNYDVISTFSGSSEGETHGAISHFATVVVPDVGIAYVARSGIWLFNGKKFTLISEKIQGSVDEWNQAQLNNAVAFQYHNKVYFCVTEGTSQISNNYTYVWSWQYGWWTRHNIGMRAAGTFQGSTEEPTPYFTDQSGNLFQYDVGGNDNGAAIDAYFQTKAFDFNAVANQKIFLRAIAFAQAEVGNYNLTLTFIRDFTKPSTVTLPLGYTAPTTWGNFAWGQGNWGSAEQVSHITTNVPGLCRYLSFKIEGTDKDAPFTFYGVALQYQVRPQVI